MFAFKFFSHFRNIIKKQLKKNIRNIKGNKSNYLKN